MPCYFPDQDIIWTEQSLQPPKIGISTYTSNSHRNQGTDMLESKIKEPISSPEDFLNHSKEIRSWPFYETPTTKSSFAFDASKTRSSKIFLSNQNNTKVCSGLSYQIKRIHIIP